MRPWSGLIDKNSEPASAVIIATSPAVMNACTRARRRNGVITLTAGVARARLGALAGARSLVIAPLAHGAC